MSMHAVQEARGSRPGHLPRAGDLGSAQRPRAQRMQRKERGEGRKAAAGGTWRAQEILTAPCARERPLVRSRPCPLWSTSVKRWNARTTRPSLVLTTPCGASLSPARSACSSPR